MRSIISIIIVCIIFMVSMCQAADTVKIAVIGPKTGDAALSNLTLFLATRFFVEELNQQGGLLGKQVELVEVDNQSTPLGSKLAAQKAGEIGVIGVIGAFRSSHSLGMAPVLQETKIPMISPSSTNPQVTLVGDYIFRACFTDPFQGTVMANFARQDLNAKTAVALTKAGDTYSVGLAQMFITHFQEQGGEVLWEGNYLKESKNFRQMLEKTKSLSPDVVFVPGYSQDSGLILKQARKMGISAIFLGGDGWAPEMYDYAGDAMNGSYKSAHWFEEAGNEKSKAVMEKFIAYHGEELGGMTGLLLTYDAMSLFVDAVHRANSFDPSAIRDALAATKDFPGVTGNISFDQNGDSIKSAVVLKFNQGTWEYVKTVEP